MRNLDGWMTGRMDGKDYHHWIHVWKQMFPMKLKNLVTTGIKRTSVQNLQTHNMDLQMNFIKLILVCSLGRIGWDGGYTFRLYLAQNLGQMVPSW
jgi:hypothetical protein